MEQPLALVGVGPEAALDKFHLLVDSVRAVLALQVVSKGVLDHDWQRKRRLVSREEERYEKRDEE